jgi:hypothetical protein
MLMPPQPVGLFGTVTAGLAVLVRSCLVALTFLTRSGRADHSRATTPTTCGPAIEVPLKFAYEISVALVAERFETPGAEISGFMRPEPSTVTGPRLLKLAREFALL